MPNAAPPRQGGHIERVWLWYRLRRVLKRRIDRVPNRSYNIGIAAQAVAAAQFARCGFGVSVQYAANQPEYDLIVAKGDTLLYSRSQ